MRAIAPIKVKLNCNGTESTISQLEVSYDLPKILCGYTTVCTTPTNTTKRYLTRASFYWVIPAAVRKNDLVALEASFRGKLTDWLKAKPAMKCRGLNGGHKTFVQEKYRGVLQTFGNYQFSISRGSGEFSNLNQAYDIATKAYAMIEEKDTLSEPVEGIMGAIELWEMAMGNPQINARSDAKKLKLRLPIIYRAPIGLP